MACRSSLVSEDQLLCPICLGVFVRPVTTPCGHSYCLPCLSSYWDGGGGGSGSGPVYTCPICKERFTQRPDLKVNTCISSLVQQFESTLLCEDERRDTKDEVPTRVLCDICTETQQEALKSCVECMTSYCELHLEPHRRVAGLKRHTLVQPVANLDVQICKDHNQLLTLFCKDEEVLLCGVCSSSHHSHHKTVHLQQACDDLKAKLDGAEARVQATIQDGIQKVASIAASIQQERDRTKCVIADSVQTLNVIVSKLQITHGELVKTLEDKQEEATLDAEDVVNEMEGKIANLTTIEAKIKELKDVKDPFVFLQNYKALSLLLESADFSSRFRSNVELQEMRKSLRRSLQTLMEKIDKEISLLSYDLINVQKYAVDFILDPKTAHSRLTVSNDLKEVKFNPDPTSMFIRTPKMFSCHYFVLGATALSGQFYFEVFVGKKTEWILGVATESIERKGLIRQVRGCGLWALNFRLNTFERYCCPKVEVHKGKVERVGVFVDCEGGRVMFYDVKAAILIHLFTDCVFTERLYPIFNPCDNELGNNLGPMRIVAVNQE